MILYFLHVSYNYSLNSEIFRRRRRRRRRSRRRRSILPCSTFSRRAELAREHSPHAAQAALSNDAPVSRSL